MIINRQNIDSFRPGNIDIRDGVITLIDKPLEWTSFDVVKRVRNYLDEIYNVKRFKVGHAGTLDPLASGLLIILMGDATKKQRNFMEMDKVYDAEMTLGYTTASYDAEKEKIKGGSTDNISEDDIRKAKEKFIGKQIQIPPVFSAIKIDGQPLYKKARQGKEVQARKRIVNVHSIDIYNVEEDTVSFTVNCESGTYIRSLAHDWGQNLGCGAYLSGLRRLSIGEHKVEDSLNVEEIVSVLENRFKAIEE